jgi:hypothetical protein
MGYVGYSMSERAVAAYESGEMPASKLAKALKVSTAAVKAVMSRSSWHHTSKNYNSTDFFSWDFEAEGEEAEDQAEVLAKMQAFDLVEKSAVKAAPPVEFAAHVKWLDWSGSRNHPTCTKLEADARVTKKGATYTIQIFGKPSFQKRETTNGLEVRSI